MKITRKACKKYIKNQLTKNVSLEYKNEKKNKNKILICSYKKKIIQLIQFPVPWVFILMIGFIINEENTLLIYYFRERIHFIKNLFNICIIL